MSKFQSGSDKGTVLTGQPMNVNPMSPPEGRGNRAASVAGIGAIAAIPIAEAIARLVDLGRKMGKEVTVGDALRAPDALDKFLQGTEDFANAGPASNALVNILGGAVPRPKNNQ